MNDKKWKLKDCPLCKREGIVKPNHYICRDCYFGNIVADEMVVNREYILRSHKPYKKIFEQWKRDKKAHPWLTETINAQQRESYRRALYENSEIHILNKRYEGIFGGIYENDVRMAADQRTMSEEHSLLDIVAKREDQERILSLVGIPCKMLSYNPPLFDTGLLFQAYDFNSGSPGFKPENMGFLSKENLSCKSPKSAAIKRAAVQLVYYARSNDAALARYIGISRARFGQILREAGNATELFRNET